MHLVHHPHKSSQDRENHIFNAAGNAKITNFAEFAVEMRPGAEDGQIICTVVKQRNYVAHSRFAAEFHYEHKGDSFDLDSFNFAPVRAVSQAQQKKDVIQESIVIVLQQGGGIKKMVLRDKAQEQANSALNGKAHAGQSAITREIDAMINDGRITVSDGKYGAKLCTLTASFAVF